MIHWWWIIPAIMFGGTVGTLMIALMAANYGDDDDAEFMDHSSG